MAWRLFALVLVACAASLSLAQTPRQVSRAEYGDRLRAMWLGECIANWTGLRTEGHRPGPVFFTDADWGQDFLGAPLDYVLTQNPWWADDDTDIEYVYLHLLATQGGTSLSTQQIADGWTQHINRFIWVSNASARAQIGRGVLPPVTGMGVANVNRLMIDAQLTTEFFGAMCPGMAERGLEVADLPIRTTASGYAAHASQFYVVLYALAPFAPTELSGREKAIWLYERARAYLPSTSKSADICDFVYADFLANPDSNNWERTRDLVYQRYQGTAWMYGFQYRAWYESSVNFASGVMALLYGECDFRKTVRIGTLSGWDSDNATATLGGMIGLMQGYTALTANFPGVNFSDRFWILRTRDALPDYLPGDAAAEDTLTLMANRMLDITEREIVAAGGLVDIDHGAWLLPPANVGSIAWNPRQREDARSANNAVRRAGGTVTATSSVAPGNTGGRGSSSASFIANGVEGNYEGREESDANNGFYCSLGAAIPPGAEVVLSVTYDRDVPVALVRFIEGERYDDGVVQGGWFANVAVEVLQGGVWNAVVTVPSAALDAAVPFQMIDYVLATPTTARGVRVRGLPGGTNRFVTCAELDALGAETTPTRATWDANGDARLDVDDLYAWEAARTDLTGDGMVDPRDRVYEEAAIRWREWKDMTTGR